MPFIVSFRFFFFFFFDRIEWFSALDSFIMVGPLSTIEWQYSRNEPISLSESHVIISAVLRWVWTPDVDHTHFQKGKKKAKSSFLLGQPALIYDKLVIVWKMSHWIVFFLLMYMGPCWKVRPSLSLSLSNFFASWLLLYWAGQRYGPFLLIKARTTFIYHIKGF